MVSSQNAHSPMDLIDCELFDIGLKQLEAGEYQGAIETFLDLQERYPDSPEIATRLRQARCLARFPFLRPLASLAEGWVCKSPMNLAGLAAISLVVLIGVAILMYRMVVTPPGPETSVPPFSGTTEVSKTVVIITTENPEPPSASTETTEGVTEAPTEAVTEMPETQERPPEKTAEPPPITLPSAPTSVKAVSATETSITLSWQNNADNQMKLVVKRDANPVAELPVDSQSYTDSDLACGRSFTYMIVAVNEAGESEPAQIIAQTKECPPPHPPPSSFSGKIVVPVFDTKAGAYNVYIARASDGWQRKLFFQNGSQPAFSPDGQQIILRSWRSADQGIGQRLVFFPSLKTDAGDERLMTYNLEDAHPSLSRNGDIVFHTRRQGQPVLFTLGTWEGAENSVDNQVMLGLGENPDWLESSALDKNRRIIYYAPGPPSGLYVMNDDGGNVRLVLSEPGSLAPAAAPDGDHVAVSLQRGGRWHIFTLSVSQGQSSLVQLTNENADDQLPVWSPDGQSIAFVSNREGKWAVWVMPAYGAQARMNANETNQRKLFDLNGPIDGTVSIAPDMSFGWGEERLSWAP